MNKTLTATVCAALLCTLAACDKTAPPLPSTQADSPAPGAVSVAATPSFDPSLPSAEAASVPAASPTSRDDNASRPLGELSKADESSAMPKAGQANNHSSPSLEASAPAR